MRASRIYASWETRPDQVDKMWEQVGERRHEDWNLPRVGLLQEIVGNAVTNAIYGINDSAARNRELRKQLSPILLGKDHHQKTQLAKWIVVEWGGIKAGDELAFAEWIKLLGRFDKSDISYFVKMYGQERVSSWSKILAFARPNDHAIYDARTAVALNVALSKANVPVRFHMPATQNTNLPDAIKQLKQEMFAITGGRPKHYQHYDSYIRLLKSLVSRGHAPNLLEAEMTLFANAEHLATTFANAPTKEQQRVT